MFNDMVMDPDLMTALEEWTRKHVAFDARRVKPLMQIIADSAGHEDKRVQEAFYKISVWIFGVDDVYDAEDLSIADLRSITGFLCKDGPLSLPEEKVAIVHNLRNTFHELLLIPPGLMEDKQGYQYLLDRRDEVAMAMLAEAVNKTTAITPGIDQYLETGSLSIATHFIFPYLFCIMDRTFFTTGKHLLLNDLIMTASALIRLENDKASYKKEMQENKANSVSILWQGLSSTDSINKAVQQVEDMITERMLQLERLTASYPDETLKRFGNFVITVCKARQRLLYAVPQYS